mmetsp:Transcript_22066/g.21248  ORF Transcript_22066/g.21248 Transcript_22066/m.21248 type:complete len:85 (+) Transcript_22066:381-635(+)
MEGYNYAQKKRKGATKLEPIIGQPHQQGIIPRFIQDIFKQAKKKESMYHVQIFCSFLQIYQEKIFDLFSQQQSQGLRLRWTKQD